MNDHNIRYPEMRQDMLSYLSLVAKLEAYQSEKLQYEDLEHIIHFFFDDTDLAKSAKEYLGYTLFSDSEICVMREFGARLDEYLELTAPDAEPLIFINGESWQAVVKAADFALEVLTIKI